jgi:hypothetical protein
MVTAWDGDSCLIRVKGEENFKKLRLIYNELINGNCAVWLGGGGVFQNAGLCFAIINKIPEKNLKEMRDGDIDREKLNHASEATGIKKKIDEANEQWRNIQEVESGRSCYDRKWGYYALSPRWANSDEKKKTKHPVVYWLNPMHQDRNNFGWFTVEDLEKWLEGKGPIPGNRK